MKLFKSPFSVIFACYFLLLVLYSVFSFALTAPNLILTGWTPYWNFQLYMWRTFFNNRELLAQSYFLIVTALFICYFWLIHRAASVADKVIQSKYTLLFVLVIAASAPLLLSNNALSYDVFNYIFNAKMVVVFKANPHLQTATNFLYDDWTRFMHNTHTTAPYGYGWTGLSLIPFFLGGGKFLSTWLAFRAFSFLSVVLLTATYLYGRSKSWLTLNTVLIVLINPLMLIEIISNSHNDLWMMVPAVWSLLLLHQEIQRPKRASFLYLVLSGFALLFSITIKLATVVLTPLWLLLVLIALSQQIRYSWWVAMRVLLERYWPFLASILMFVPLLTLRSQQFHPWYLTWVLVWLPFMAPPTKLETTQVTVRTLALFKPLEILLHTLEKAWIPSVLVLSVSSMLRYLPYMYVGTYGGNVLWHQKLISWGPFVIALLYYHIFRKFRLK